MELPHLSDVEGSDTDATICPYSMAYAHDGRPCVGKKCVRYNRCFIENKKYKGLVDMWAGEYNRGMYGDPYDETIDPDSQLDYYLDGKNWRCLM